MNLKKHISQNVFRAVTEVAAEEKVPAYVIGGYVRDCILGRPSKDIDIVVAGAGIKMARLVAKKLGGLNVSVFENFGTAMFRYEDCDIEFVGARKESYRRESRKPIVEEGSLEDDQLRRDFTINTLAISLNTADLGELVDPFNGSEDLEDKIIRTPTDPRITFSDDPLRMLRAIRFATQLGFTIEDKTLSAIILDAPRIDIISKERILDELNKIVMSSKPSVGFKLLEECGLLKLIFPELSALKGVESVKGIRHKDNFYHTLEVLDNLVDKTDNIWLRWTAIFHDIGKPISKRFSPDAGWTFHGHEVVGHRMLPEIFRRMKLPQNQTLKYIQKLVMLHLRPIALVQDEVSDSAVRRLLFEAGDDIDDLMLLCQADITSKNEDTKSRHLNNFELVKVKLKEIEEKDAIRNFQPPVDGKEIMEIFGLQPCSHVGDIKNAIKDAILDGIIPNKRDEAYRYMLETGAKLGLSPVKKNE